MLFQTYLTAFFLRLDYQKDQAKAEEKAAKTPVNGQGIYKIPEEDWRAKYDIQGMLIYNELQRSKHGYVSSLTRLF